MNLSEVLVYACLLTFSVWLIIYNWKRRHLYIFSWKTIGPWALPIIGNLYMLPGKMEDMFDYLKNLSKDYEDKFPARFWLGNTLTVLIYKPEHMKIVYNNILDRTGQHNNFTMDIHGRAFVSLNREEWKPLRKMLNPRLNTIAINQFIEPINYHISRWVKNNKYLAGTGVVDFTTELGPAFMDTIYETALGIRTDMETVDKKLSLKIQRLYNMTLERVHNIIYHYTPLFYLTKKGKEHLRFLKDIDEIHYKLVAQKKKMIEDHKKDGKSNTPGYMEPFFMENMTDKELRDHLTALAFAGSDTAMAGFCFILLALAVNQDAQRKVHEELDSVFGDDKERPVTVEDIPKLTYLEQCIKETMRFFPTTLATIRYVSNDTNIDGHTIPAGACVLMMTYPLHYNEKYWPEPLKFKPERFAPENLANWDMYCYQAFVSGPRNCIGMKFGILALKIQLATILRTFKVKSQQYSSLQDVKILWKMNLYPKEGYGTELELR